MGKVSTPWKGKGLPTLPPPTQKRHYSLSSSSAREMRNGYFPPLEKVLDLSRPEKLQWSQTQLKGALLSSFAASELLQSKMGKMKKCEKPQCGWLRETPGNVWQQMGGPEGIFE